MPHLPPCSSFRLLELVEEPSQPHPPLLAKYLKVDERIAHYVLGSDALDERIQPYTVLRDPQAHLDALLVDADVTHRLGQFVRNSPTTGRVVVYLRGPYGVGRQSTAEAVCEAQGLRLLVVDLEQLTGDGDASYAKALSLIQREAKLQQAAVYWQGFDTLLDEQKKGLFRIFLRHLEDRPALTFFAGERLWEPADALRGAPFACVELRRPTFAERSRLWSATLNGHCLCRRSR